MTRDVADDSQDWWWFQKIDYFHSLWNWSQNWLHVHTFSGLIQLKAPIEWASHLDLRHFCGHTPRLVCPDTKTGEGFCCSDQMSLTGFDKTCLQKHMPQELYEKNLSRTWEDLDSCMAQSSGPRDNYLGAYFSARGSPRVVAHSQNHFMFFLYGQNGEKNACFQNSEPGELGRVYKQTALLLLLTVAPTSNLFFTVGSIVDKVTVVPASDVNIHTFAALFWDCCWQMNWYSQPKSIGQNDWFLSWMLSLSSYVWWKWTMYEWFPFLHLHYHLKHLFPTCACYSIMRIYTRQDSPYKGHLYHKRPPRWTVSSWKHP